MVRCVERDTAYDDYCEARAEEKNEARQIERHFEELQNELKAKQAKLDKVTKAYHTTLHLKYQE